MNTSIKRPFKVFVLSAALLGGLTTSSQAGIIPWLYDAVFGPPGSMMHTTGYGYRGYYSPYAHGASYGWGAGYSYAPAYGAGCNSCATTSSYYGPVTYGVAGNCCATNDCGVPASGNQTTTQRPTPPPAGNGPEPDKTFGEPMNGDDGFRPNTRGDSTNSTNTEAFRIPGNQTIPQRPTPAGESDSDAVEDEKTDEPQVDQFKVPTLNLDTAATTKPLVAHARTEWHARFVTPTIARKVRPIQSPWTQLTPERRLAGR